LTSERRRSLVDPRINKLTDMLLNYSCQVKKGENVLIQCYGMTALPLVKSLVRGVYSIGALPFVTLKDDIVQRELIAGCRKDQLELMSRHDMVQMKDIDAFIGIRAHDNVNELGGLPSDKMNSYMQDYSSIIADERVNNTKWVVLRWPNNSMAQLANTSLEAFEDFYFDVCTIDYSKMSKAMDSIIELMDRTDKVHIKGPGTDLSFSIKNIPTIKAAGERNIPDGEVFTAPVRESIKGDLTYNTPAGMVLAKYIHYGATLSIFILVSFLTNFFYTDQLFAGGILSVGIVLRSALLYILYYCVLLAILLYLSSLFKRGLAAGIIVLVMGYTMSIFNQFPDIRPYLPNYLLYKAADIGNVFNNTLIPTLIISLALIIIFVFLTVRRMKKIDIA